MAVTNLVALQFAMGYQGGTVHQMAQALRVNTSDILNADDERMSDLLRLAQKHHVLREELKNKVTLDRAAYNYLCNELNEMIDGGEECRGRDSTISHILGVLQDDPWHKHLANQQIKLKSGADLNRKDGELVDDDGLYLGKSA